MSEMHLQTEGGIIRSVGPNTLLIFLDETGEEKLSDPNAPFFGFGGVVVENRNYLASVESPWHLLKERHFDGADSPLHAADLRKPSRTQIEALNHFFTQHRFGRFAATCTDRTINKLDTPIEEVVATTLWDRFKEVANQFSWHNILILYEENRRLIPALKRELFSKTPENQSGVPIPVESFTVMKDPRFAGMEVADFVAHTAGRQSRIMRNHLFDKRIDQEQPDFAKVFDRTFPISYLNISRVSKKSQDSA